MGRFNEIYQHLSNLISNKHILSDKLHLPHKRNYIPIEESYHKYVNNRINSYNISFMFLSLQ